MSCGVAYFIAHSSRTLLSYASHIFNRTATIDCLTEIASLPPHDIPDAYRPGMQQLLVHVIESLAVIVPRSADLQRAFEEGTEEDCLFIKRLALLLGTLRFVTSCDCATKGRFVVAFAQLLLLLVR